MNRILQKIGDKFIKLGLSLSSFYEGHRPSRRYESLPRMIGSQDDFNEAANDREQLMSAARAICTLFGLPNRILKTYANYVIGECPVLWNTSDDKWNDAANEWWKTQAAIIDISGRYTFAQLMRLSLISQLRDGDVGFLKVKSNNRIPGFAAVQLVEADRIRYPSIGMLDNNRLIYGGVEIDRSSGRPIAYYICERDRFGTFKEPQRITSENFILFYDSLRYDVSRGVTAFANGGLIRSRILREIIKCEETGVLTANKWSVAIKANNSNYLLQSDILSDNYQGQGQEGKKNLPSITDLYDGLIVTLEPGEDISILKSDRPSPAWQGFVDYLIRDIAVSLDLPSEFVWDMSKLSGPAVRMVSKQAERTFRNVWYNIEHKLMRPLVSWCVSVAMDDGVLPFNKEFYNFLIQRPDLPTIDVGRESQANLNEWNAGLLTGAEICKERGINIYEVMEQRAREIAYAKELANKYGLNPEQIYKL